MKIQSQYQKHLLIIFSFFIIVWEQANAEDMGAKPTRRQMQLQSAKEDVESACESEAIASGCTGKKVSEGLLKCIRDYKNENSGFEYTSNCLKQARAYHVKIRANSGNKAMIKIDQANERRKAKSRKDAEKQIETAEDGSDDE